MKYSSHIFAGLLLASLCLLRFYGVAWRKVLEGGANEECKYCDADLGSLPAPMVETLKEMSSQQKSASPPRHSPSHRDHKVSAFLIETSPNQDVDYITVQLIRSLAAFGVSSTSEVEVGKDDGGLFCLILPNVSLESLPYGPFELSYHLKEGFGLSSVEPLLDEDAYFADEKSENDGKLQRSSGGSRGAHQNREGVSGNVCVDTINKEWHLKHTKVPEAWEYSEKEDKPSQGEGIVIFQIDTGYSDHPFFTEIWNDPDVKGKNMYTGTDDPRDSLASLVPGACHGTVVASAAMNRGTVMMTTIDSNGKDITNYTAPRGVAPKAKLYSIRAVNNPVLDSLDSRRVTKAFKQIAQGDIDGVHVVSVSLGTPFINLSSMRKRINEAIEKKNIIVVAAGGQIAQPVLSPARFPEVIAVGGYRVAEVEENGAWYERKMQWWDKAATGGKNSVKIDIAGPALNVCNANIVDKTKFIYKPGEGTSLATAMTGGVAALWLAHWGRDNLIKFFKDDKITLQEAFRKVLELSANTDNWLVGNYTRKYGHGMINTEKVLKISLETVKNQLLKTNTRGSRAADSSSKVEIEDVSDVIKEILIEEMGYVEEDLSSFSSDDLEQFYPELDYIKVKGGQNFKLSDPKNNVVMSTALRAHLESASGERML